MLYTMATSMSLAIAEDVDCLTKARSHRLDAWRIGTNGERCLFRMEKRPEEGQVLSWEQTSRRHWTAFLSQILIIPSLLAYLLLCGTYCYSIGYFLSYKGWIITLEGVSLVLSVLLSVLLCIVSGVACSFARAPRWHSGRKLAIRGLVVGGIGILLLGGLLLISFLLARSLAGSL